MVNTTVIGYQFWSKMKEGKVKEDAKKCSCEFNDLK